MKRPEDVSLSDKEFVAVRAQVESCCSPSALMILYQVAFDLIPPPLQKRLSKTDPGRIPIRAGERIGHAMGLEEEMLQIFALGFGTRVWGISAERAKEELGIRNSAPVSSRNHEFDPEFNTLIGVAERLAGIFTLPDLTPTSARRIIAVAIADLDKGES